MLSQWSDGLSIDYDELDRDHKEMIEIIDHLHHMPDNGPRFAEVEDEFCSRLNAIEAHFFREELYMDKINYPNRSTHIKEHARLLAVFRSSYYEKDAQPRPARQTTLINLSLMVIDHINCDDRALAQFCQIAQVMAA